MDTDHDQQTHPNLVEVVTLFCDGDISIFHKDVHALTDLVGFGVGAGASSLYASLANQNKITLMIECG